MKPKRNRSHSKDADTNITIANHRKRSRSSLHDGAHNSIKPSSDTGSKQPSSQEDVVHHISNFLSTKKSEMNEDISSILFLTQHLESTAAAPDVHSDVSITKQDVATQLLPWSVASLMRASSDTSNETITHEVVWRTLSCCLDILSSNDDTNEDCAVSETTLNNCLSQNTLAKSIEAAASSSFGGKVELQQYASNCFLKLVKRYRPSFEVACTTLLKHVEDLVCKDKSTAKELPKHQYEVVCGALQSIHNLLSGANVKRSFAVLSSAEMLSRLGRLGFVKRAGPDCTKVEEDDANYFVESLTRDGLFHQTHHMDGFRTMDELRCLPPMPKFRNDGDTVNAEQKEKKQKSGVKSCYQSGLFKSLRVLLSDSDPNDIIAITRLVPILVRGFFGHIQTKYQTNDNSGIVVSTEADAKLQLYFWARIIITAFERINVDAKSNVSLDTAMLEMTSETLKMVLDFDAYSPSYSDPDEAMISFLKFVTREIVQYVETCDCSQSSVYLLSSVRTLLLLNHRLLHEELSTYIAFACTNLDHTRDDERIKSDAPSLLITIVKTYGELRQTGYFLSATRDAFVVMKSPNIETNSMHSMFRCREVMELLATTFQTLPSGQLHELWEFFDEWILAILANEETSDALTELLTATRMFILYIRSIRVDKHNSAELRELCEKTMASSVGKLLDSSKDTAHIFTSQGVDLCGWLVDLHTRSCFWIDNIFIDGGHSAFLLTHSGDDNKTLNVLSHLRDVATKTVESKKFKAWVTEWEQCSFKRPTPITDETLKLSIQASLLRLALHRIHQLHSIIYYCKVEEHEQSEAPKDTRNSSSDDFKEEAMLLVDFAVFTAELLAESQLLEFEHDSMWSTIAQSLGTMCHYAKHHHMRAFLNWFFSTLSQSESTITPSLDITCVLSLVRDASFYEVSGCATMLLQEGVVYTLGVISPCLDNSHALEVLMKKHSSGIAASCLSVASPSKTKPNDIKNAVTGVSTVISFLSSAPLDLSASGDILKLLDKAVGLDILVSKINNAKTSKSERYDGQLVKALHATRCFMTVILPKAIISSSGDVSLLMLATDHLITSCELLNGSDDVLSVTGDVLCEIFTVCIDHDQNDRLLFEFLKKVNTLYFGDDAISLNEFACRASLIKSVLRRMNTITRRYQLEKTARQLCINETYRWFKDAWSRIIYEIEHRNSSATHTKNASIAVLLASEAFAFMGNAQLSSNLLAGNDVDTKPDHFEELFDLLSSINYATESDDFKAAIQYFLSSILTTSNMSIYGIPSTAVIDALLGALEEMRSPILEAALYSIMRESSVDVFQNVISHLSRRTQTAAPNFVFVVKVYHVLIHCVKSKDQIDYLSTQSMSIFLASMCLLRTSNERNEHNVNLFSTIMSSLITRKDLLLLTGREIAMICSGMSSVFNIPRMRDEDTVGETKEFKSCCSVISSLLTNYPKQLYGSPNSLFGVLLAMLGHLLQTNNKRCLNVQALEYAKICELLIPHKDIFKKHVIGLILRFIRSLNNGMTTFTKSKLIPSIHGLLDMCSDYEMRQINAMIDAPSKALFAPVFQSYQKYYRYHGT